MQPDSLPPSSSQSKFSPVIPLLFLLLSIAIGLGYYYYHLLNPEFSIIRSFRTLLPAVSITPMTTPPETAQAQPSEGVGAAYKIPSGSQTYQFNHGSLVQGPKIQTLNIDPVDPPKGTTQKITLEISSKSALKQATVIIQTDHLNKNLNLKFISGTLEKGLYGVSWTVSDTYANQYSLHFILADETETYDNTMYLR